MKLGMTGTRLGMTEQQKEAFANLILALKPLSLAHGDCAGSDDQAATIAHLAGVDIICHPPVDEKLRAFNRFAKLMHPAKTHFARNRDIVDSTDALVALPPCQPLPDRGGTAYTVNVAIKKGKPVCIIWPDGTTTRENWPVDQKTEN